MIRSEIKFIFCVLLFGIAGHAQSSSCSGSQGEPLFTETFGNGTSYGPPLPAGITTYPFVTGAPNDGQYTLYYNSYLYTTWHNSPDHTPDATNGPNGKMLLVNANATTSGEFYKRTVTGLCVNTTFEFSAWLMNVYNPNTNYCGAGQIPINVRFEILDATETTVLVSGNTGNIYGSPAPTWQQFSLSFTTSSETSVVLKMKNNGLGGCGNDLAIDDISFSACSDLTTVSSPSVAGTTLTTCTNPVSVQLNASTAVPSGAPPYFYQWQSSIDGVTWTDVTGATNPAYTTPNLTAETYYRVKAAQDPANLASAYCSGISNVFTISPLPGPAPAVSNGNAVICSGASIPSLSVTTGSGTSVNWYDAPSGGNLLQAGSLTYVPSSAGTYYAETYNTTSNCVSATRTPVSLTIVPLPDATISGNTTICGGNTAVITFTGTPGATVTFNDGTASHNLTLDAGGSATYTTPVLSATTAYTLVSVASGSGGTCVRPKNDTVTVTVNNVATASFSVNSPICYGSTATLNFTGTPGAQVSYLAGSAAHTVVLDATGAASASFPNMTATTVFSLTSVDVGGTCIQSLSQTHTVTVVPVPVVSISANPPAVCSGQSSTIQFSGTPSAVVTYQIAGGPNQTVALNASGLTTVSSGPLTVNTTYTLVSIASPALPSCSTAATGSATVTVNSLPAASVSTNAPVCWGTSATITFSGTPNAVVTYAVSGQPSQTVTLDSVGHASLTVANVTSSSVYTLISVAGANGCTKVLSQSVTVSSLPAPAVSISVSPAILCAGESASIVFTGTPNAVVNYSTGTGSQVVTLDASGNALVPTGPLSANATYQLVSASIAGCGGPASGSASITVNPVPVVTYSGSLNYCDGEQIAIGLSSALPGTVFTWTVTQNGTTGAVAGNGDQIAQSVSLSGSAAGTVTYVVTPSNNGCSGNPITFTATVHPRPVPKIADGVICTTGSGDPSTQYYILDTQLSTASGYSFQWFLGPALIAGASLGTYNATQTGTYTVIATSPAGCASDPVSAVVGQMPQGESLTITHSAPFADDPVITVVVNGGGGPFLYQLDNGPAQSSNVFYHVPPGTHSIIVTDENCTYLTGEATIIDYPKFFTPNGDGFNETWNITGVGEATIFIFDRYGKLLKQIAAEGAGWDGTYNGHAMPASDYWFVIRYNDDGAQKTFRAHFSLKR